MSCFGSLNYIPIECNIKRNLIISNGTKEQCSRNCKSMNIRKGEELLPDSIG